MKNYLLCLLLLFYLPLQANASGWIIDTDVGVDDILAMLFMLKQPQVDLKAITIESDGIADCRPAFANVQTLLQLTHHPKIPVTCGRLTPLQGTHHFPKALIENTDKLASTTAMLFPPQAKEGAKNLFVRTLLRSPQPLNILAIGPLTTIAQALQEEPRIKAKIHKIYIMGGAIAVPGNVHETDPSQANQTAEWNIYIDPLAAKIVLESGLPIVLIPLDVTNQVSIDQSFYEQLQQRQSTPTAQLAYTLLNRHKAWIDQHQWYFWDPLAAAIAQDESLAHFETLPIRVLLHPDSLSGATVIDKERGHPVQVCIAVNKDKFKKNFLLRLTS